MGKWIHRLSNIDAFRRTAMCSNCGPVTIRRRGIHDGRNDAGNWRCNKIDRGINRFEYRLFKKDYCESCGFIAEDSCQLDVHHKDGNRKNNNSDNLETLCANCHRLKTKKQKSPAI
jgi:hypothetical protein